jgi:hypothetical protein
MKKLGSNTGKGAFDLLDGEEGWYWGKGNIGFDTQIENYLAAVTELGRSIMYSDRNGKWATAYNWQHSTKKALKQGKYTKKQKDRLTTLPYLMVDRRAEKQSSMVQLLVEFKLKYGRLPVRRISNERSAAHTSAALCDAIRKGVLSRTLVSKLEGNGIFLGTARTPSRRLSAVELFVTRHKRRPISCRTEGSEHKVYWKLNTLRNTSAKGLLSPEDTKRLQALERKMKEYEKQNKRVRLAG